MDAKQSVAAAKPSLAKKTASASFRLRNGSLNAVRLRRVFDLFDRNGDGEITVDELAQALDALGLVADRDGLAATVSAYVPEGAAGLRFEDFDALHRALGDALFGSLDGSRRRRARRRRRRRGGGDAGGVQGVRRRRRRVHLGVGAPGGAQEARPPGGRQPRHRAGDDLQRRPQQRRPRRLRRVQVHDAGHHRLGPLISTNPFKHLFEFHPNFNQTRTRAVQIESN
ncbi:hypothetical protein EE612_042087 [Oryza sativa]|nr:hypothetical protein EE612_042087 [Oryza sativa]